VEIYNDGNVSVPLVNTNGFFRLDGGISFSFDKTAVNLNGVGVIPPITLAHADKLLVVSFDPSVPGDLQRFKSFYGIQSSNVLVMGPFIGHLKNSSDRVALEKPQAPDLPGEPASWVIVDEVIYTDESGGDGTGESLERKRFDISGNDPTNFSAGLPTPGFVPGIVDVLDSDGDGLPDYWEITYALNPYDPADALQDKDGDGLSNLAEFIAGTNPIDPASRLGLQVQGGAIGAIKLSFEAGPDKTYTIQFRDDFSNGSWQRLQNVSGGTARQILITDSSAAATHRYYRIVTPSAP
jgi:hypothetical protein